MKIAIVVHGRFHAFDLARELSRVHEVTVFTDYPAWAVERFGLTRKQVRSHWAHGLASRATWWVHQRLRLPFPERSLHRWFGQWAAAHLRNEPWDVVHSFSGVSEELLQALEGSSAKTMIVRGSAHIRTQSALLQEEEQRTGGRLNRPSGWIIEREEREYALAERIVVLSTFARDSFLAQGISETKIRLLPLGSDVTAFRPSRQVVDQRCRRIQSRDPLRILYVGALSYQKGMWDMRTIVDALGSNLQFRLIGPVAPEVHPILSQLAQKAQVIPKQPQSDLPQWYSWADVFVFPTIQDGFAAVLAQAQASALPIITTTNCCGPDIIRAGESGWVVPIRSPEAIIDRLRWCDSHREGLAACVRYLHESFQPRSWEHVARDFEHICAERGVGRGR